MRPQELSVSVLVLICVLGVSGCGPEARVSNCKSGAGESETARRLMVAFDESAKELVSVAIPDSVSIEDAQRDLAALPGVHMVEPDYLLHATLVGPDPLAGKQWAHSMVQSATAWTQTKGNPSLVVAVIDSGVDYRHEDLARNMWRNIREVQGNGLDDDANGYVDDLHGWDFVNQDRDPMGDDSPYYHGTHVAGTIGGVGENGKGITGHAPNIRLMALKFLRSGGSGYTSDAVKAIDYAIENGARVINASWGTYSYSNALNSAMKRAHEAGLLFVAAAGNDGKNTDLSPFYPASYPYANVVSVAATNQKDEVVTWSNFGPGTVDIAAPGQSIFSTRNGNGYAYMSGTSMAAPLVSGVSALLWSKSPALTAEEVRRFLMASATRGTRFKTRVLSGRVDAGAAMRSLIGAPLPEETPAPTPPTPPIPDQSPPAEELPTQICEAS